MKITPTETDAEVRGRGAEQAAGRQQHAAFTQQAGAVIIVANELYSDGIAYAPETDRFLRDLGGIAAELSAAANALPSKPLDALPLIPRSARCSIRR